MRFRTELAYISEILTVLSTAVSYQCHSNLSFKASTPSMSVFCLGINAPKRWHQGECRTTTAITSCRHKTNNSKQQQHSLRSSDRISVELAHDDRAWRHRGRGKIITAHKHHLWSFYAVRRSVQNTRLSVERYSPCLVDCDQNFFEFNSFSAIKESKTALICGRSLLSLTSKRSHFSVHGQIVHEFCYPGARAAKFLWIPKRLIIPFKCRIPFDPFDLPLSARVGLLSAGGLG